MQLEHFADLSLPRGTEHLVDKVSLELSLEDGMYAGNSNHYLSCGASALGVVLATLRLADVPDPRSILDFGAGAGRVTRWIRAAFPDAAIDACDLREQDLAFCEEQFSARAWISGIVIENLQAPAKYDLIWLGSVSTHLSSTKTLELLDKMISWINPGGLVVMSFHGRYAFSRQNSGEYRYIHEEAWNLISARYNETGYGYADYEGQNGYGISVTKPSWFAKVIEERPNVKLVLLTESAWDGHHDVLGVQVLRHSGSD